MGHAARAEVRPGPAPPADGIVGIVGIGRIGPGSRLRSVGALLALLALVAAVLAPVLGAGFVFDDRADAIDNPAATPGGFFAALGVTNRPLLKATYALQRATSGVEPLPFHLVNLVLHLAATAMVCTLVRRWAAGPAAGRAVEPSGLVAWGAAAIWALHPAVVEAVAPVSGRSVLLSTVLLLGAVLLATGDGGVSRPRAAAIALLAFAAPSSRETALVLPALLLLWQATVGAAEPRARRAWRQLPALAGATLAALVLGLGDRQRELVAFSLGQRSALEALRGNLHALFEILGLWIAPDRISADPAAPHELAWSAPATLVRLALLVLVAVGVILFRRRAPRAALAAGWTLLALAPTNSILWRLDPVAPRALYLSSFGIVLALALVAARALAAPRRRPAAAAAATAAMLVVLALGLGTLARGAHRRAALWAEPAALWADAALKAPERTRPWLNLGIALMVADRLDAAEVALGAALALDPGESRARCALDSIRIRRLARSSDPRSSS